MASLNPFETTRNLSTHRRCWRVCNEKLAEGVGLAPNSLGGGLSRRARSCGKCTIKAFARRFAGFRRAETKLLGNPSSSNSGGENGEAEQKL
jgi:hypothetical protein